MIEHAVVFNCSQGLCSYGCCAFLSATKRQGIQLKFYIKVAIAPTFRIISKQGKIGKCLSQPNLVHMHSCESQF